MARGGGLDLGGLKEIRSYVRASVVSCDCTATANNAISKNRSIVVVCLKQLIEN